MKDSSNDLNYSSVPSEPKKSSIVENQASPGISMVAQTYEPFSTICPFCKKK